MLLTLPAKTNDSHLVRTLSDVHSIYVGSMGHDDEAVRFHRMLKQELTHAGFAIEEDPAKADAVLSGTLSIRVLDGYSRAFCDVTLRAFDGATLWQSAFGPRFRRFWHGNRSRDDVKNRAGDITDKLLKDLKQSTVHQELAPASVDKKN